MLQPIQNSFAEMITTNMPLLEKRMEDPTKLKVRIWACIDCGLIWRQPRFHSKHYPRPACDECQNLYSTIEITWYEVTLAARSKRPGAEGVLQELAHERA